MFRPVWLALAIALIATAPIACGEGKKSSTDSIIPVDGGDAEMNAAIAKARASIGEFWRQYENPDPGVTGLALKVSISDGKRVEHFWLIEVNRSGATLSGIINNEAMAVTTVREGERHTFKDADISDWMYVRNGKIVGNETVRVLLKHMSPEEAAATRAMLEAP
jgi:uncharacterized protein YegJ (DUF2314 family)